ncbi:MAG: uracil phosphoribosyltransferase [Bacteroidales bacterium]|jgi:uracil phosphoribosyltransferase|nr:uracil phosphoribosyltransferase [Bacteroidales bacterium]
MEIRNLGENDSAISKFVIELRDKKIQKDSLRFRKNLERIGSIIAYEISKTLNYENVDITTPLGIAACRNITDNIMVASVLRAGLPLHRGILEVFDHAQNAFIAAYRKYGKDNRFDIQLEYASSPCTEGKTIILADTMLATGNSVLLAYNRLCESGDPKHTHLVCPIASKHGIAFLSKNLPHKKVTLWVCAIDEELTNKSYIVPGLGDAGDLSFGEKL